MSRFCSRCHPRGFLLFINLESKHSSEKDTFNSKKKFLKVPQIVSRNFKKVPLIVSKFRKSFLIIVSIYTSMFLIRRLPTFQIVCHILLSLIPIMLQLYNVLLITLREGKSEFLVIFHRNPFRGSIPKYKNKSVK